MRLGDVIGDGGLRLGVLEALLQADSSFEHGPAFDAAVKRARKAHGKGDGIEYDDPEVVDDILAGAVSALAAVEVDADALDEVRELAFDGGNDIYCDLILEGLCTRLGCEDWQLDTGGEGEAFVVGSLEGVDRLLQLESLDLDAYGHSEGAHDLAPLRDHPTLRSIRLTDTATNADALETLPSLEKLRGPKGSVPADIVARLEKRGVDVQIG